MPEPLEALPNADLVVGVPLCNNAATLGGVLEGISAGLRRHFPEAETVLICSDGGSTDESRESFLRFSPSPRIQAFFLNHGVSPLQKILSPYHGIPGKENALKLVFETAQRLKARACAVIDPSLSFFNPEWLSLLLRPVLEEGYDFIAPLYSRHPFEGTITSGILYPLFRVLYRKIIRYPIAGDFAASPRLLGHLLARGISEDETARSGIDLWLIAKVLTGDFHIGQAFLGPAAQNVRDSQGSLGTIFHQALFSAFKMMEENADFWRAEGEIQAVAVFGRPEGAPPGGSFDPNRMIANFRLGAKALAGIWRKVFAPATAREVEALPRLADSRFSFPPALWARVVYDFASGFHRQLVHRDHLLKSMIPLYLGWAASFYRENREAQAAAAEETIEGLCRVFIGQKDYLLERWEGKGG